MRLPGTHAAPPGKETAGSRQENPPARQGPDASPATATGPVSPAVVLRRAPRRRRAAVRLGPCLRGIEGLFAYVKYVAKGGIATSHDRHAAFVESVRRKLTRPERPVGQDESEEGREGPDVVALPRACSVRGGVFPVPSHNAHSAIRNENPSRNTHAPTRGRHKRRTSESGFGNGCSAPGSYTQFPPSRFIRSLVLVIRVESGLVRAADLGASRSPPRHTRDARRAVAPRRHPTFIIGLVAYRS